MFEPDNVLPDRALREAPPFDVQGFLEQSESPLAETSVTNSAGRSTSVAALLERTAREARMDVRVLLVKLQVEQSLLTAEPTRDRLDWALGYGVTDSGRLEACRGFEPQLQMAARTLVGYLDSRHPLTVVGLVGKPMQVSDGVVTPRTLATAALYRYTPWIGDRPVGPLRPPFGQLLFYRVWRDLFDDEPQRTATEAGWRLIAPQDNWRNPLPLPEEAVPVMKEAAARLGLVVGEDAARRKLYLGKPRVVSPPPVASPVSAGSFVEYPSGRRLRRVTLEEIGAAEAARYLPARPAQAAPLVQAEPETELSAHFRMGEFLPRDSSYRYARVSARLVAFLEELRADLGGVPLLVNSGYRPPAYNREVGGAGSSLHLDGLAADVACLQVPFARLAEAADRLVGERGGVGLYRSQDFVHVDLRGERVRWP